VSNTINCYYCNGLVSASLSTCPHCFCNPRAYNCVFCGSKKLAISGEKLWRYWTPTRISLESKPPIYHVPSQQEPRYHLACIKENNIFDFKCAACGGAVNIQPQASHSDFLSYSIDSNKKERCSKCGHEHQPIACYYCGLPVLLESAIKINTGSYGDPLYSMFRKPWICWHKACFPLDPDSNDLIRISKEQEASRSSKNDQSKSDCFIAGVAYGSQYAPEVLKFRAFRDQRLATTKWGRCVINAYAQYSPPVAQIIAKRRFLRIIAKTVLDLMVKIVKVD
jgi:hypothetical protein